MTASTERVSPLAEWNVRLTAASDQPAAFSIRENPFASQVNLRGNPADAAFADAARGVLGCDLPVAPNTWNAGNDCQVLWLGPDEWLLKLEPEQGEAVALALRAALAGLHCSVVEVGSGNTTLTLQGPGAADLLSRGCPLDLHPRKFAAGAVAQSHVARSPVLLRCVQPLQQYEVTVRRSFAPYLFDWLCAAGWA